MANMDIIQCLVSFSGIAGSLLGFFLINVPEIEERRCLAMAMAIIAFLLWLAVPLALLSCPYTQYRGLLCIAYWSAVIGSWFAVIIIFLINAVNTLWPLIRRIVKALKWEKEATRIL